MNFLKNLSTWKYISTFRSFREQTSPMRPTSMNLSTWECIPTFRSCSETRNRHPQFGSRSVFSQFEYRLFKNSITWLWIQSRNATLYLVQSICRVPTSGFHNYWNLVFHLIYMCSYRMILAFEICARWFLWNCLTINSHNFCSVDCQKRK